MAQPEIEQYDEDGWWFAASSDGFGEPLVLGKSEASCREQLATIRAREGMSRDEAVASVSLAMERGDVFIARCAVRIAWAPESPDDVPELGWLSGE